MKKKNHKHGKRNLIEEIKIIVSNQNILKKEFLTTDEASEYLRLSKSCLHKMTSKEEIPFYKPGGKKIYFKRSELDQWVYNGKVKSTQDEEHELTDYLGRTNKNQRI